MKNMKDIKQYENKLPLEKIDPIALITLGKLQQYGATKYKDTAGMSWKCGEMETYIGALLRHLTSHQQGEIIDPESGFTHIEHLFFNAYILLWLQDRKENNEHHWLHDIGDTVIYNTEYWSVSGRETVFLHGEIVNSYDLMRCTKERCTKEEVHVETLIPETRVLKC